jgi:DNA-binding NtrC family response regulator
MTGPERASKSILLIASDLDERRLLLAELREAGYEVLPTPDVGYAIRVILAKLVRPSLVLWDKHGQPSTTPEQEQHLSNLTPNVPWMVVESAIPPSGPEPPSRPATTVLRRPIRIGEVVEAVRRVVG